MKSLPVVPIILCFAHAGCGDGTPAQLDSGTPGNDSGMTSDGGQDIDASPTVTPGYTATHFVTETAPGGGDGTQGSPWTLSEAMANAVSGNVVEVGPGVYTGTPTGDRFDPTWRFANSGSSDNPIIVYAQFPAVHNVNNRSELRSGATEDGAGNPALGCHGEDYVIWDGFFVNENDSSTRRDTGPAVLADCTGAELRRLVIQGDIGYQPVDNHCSVRIEHSNHVAVRDSRLYDNFSGSNSYNGSTIETYDSYDYVIENNELYGSDGGVFIKGMQTGQVNHSVIIRRNLIRESNLGIAIAYTAATGGTGTNGSFGTHMYQNIINGVQDGIVTRGYAAGFPRDSIIVNNLVINVSGNEGRGLYLKAGDYASDVWTNNIVVDSWMAVGAGEEDSGNGISISDNLFNGFTTRFGQFNGSNYATLVDWEANTAFGTNQVADPVFSDKEDGDYRLDSSSPGYGAGQDLLDLLGGGTSASINFGPYILSDQSDRIGPRVNPGY